MPSEQEIKQFVCNTLGCTCPDKVFEHIEQHSDIRLIGDAVIQTKLNIGNRLLVYIVEIHDSALLENNLSALVLAGRMERDRRGFNRFRLVLATGDVIEIKEKAENIFEDLDHVDEKVHLHVIGRDKIPVFQPV